MLEDLSTILDAFILQCVSKKTLPSESSECFELMIRKNKRSGKHWKLK